VREQGGETEAASVGVAEPSERGGAAAPMGAPGAAAAPEEERLRYGRLAGLPMWTAIWVLAWPILTESMLTSLVGLVDTTLSAGISEAATDAISPASYVMWFVSMIGIAVGVGATALVSRSVGRGRQAVANAAAGQATIIALVAGSVLGLLVVIAAGPIAAILGLTDEAARALHVYLYTAAVGVPLSSILLAGIACCRGAGDAMRPLWIMAFINVVNIGVSWALSGVDVARAAGFDEAGEPIRQVLIANPFPFELGILGIAIGTVVAWATGAALVLALLASGRTGVTLRRRRLAPHWHTMRRLIRVGLPNFFESVGMWLGNFLVLIIVGWMGTEGYLGAHIITVRVESFSFLPGFAMGMAAATLVGQYIGAGSPGMASKALLRCTVIAAVFMGLLGAAFILAPTTIVGWLSQQETHLEQAPRLLRVAGFIQIPFAIGLVLRTAMRGAGDTRMVMLLTWFSTFALRLPMAWFFSGVDIPLPGEAVIPNPGPDWGLLGVWIGLCSELVLRAGIFMARFVHGGWRRVSV